MNFREEHYITDKRVHRCFCGVEIGINATHCHGHKPRRFRRFTTYGYRLYSMLLRAVDEARA